MDVTGEDLAAEREAMGRLSEAAIALDRAETAVAAARREFELALAAVERLQAGSR